MLELIDLDLAVSKEDCEQQFPPLARELGELQRKARAAGLPVIVVFGGWDASGKGTVINRICQALDPRGFKVHAIQPPDKTERLYNEFERQLTDFGTVVVKFWLQIDAEEQLRRFKERQDTPYKQWKITDEDWRNRDKRPKYEPAVAEMLRRTSTPHAPWTILEANCKYYARIKAVRTVAEALEKAIER